MAANKRPVVPQPAGLSARQRRRNIAGVAEYRWSWNGKNIPNTNPVNMFVLLLLVTMIKRIRFDVVKKQTVFAENAEFMG